MATSTTTTTAAPEDTSSVNLYNRDDPYAERPIETSLIFLLCLVIAALIEGGIDYLERVENDFFQAVFNSLKQETLVAALLTFIIIFVKSMGIVSARWSILLNVSVMMFFMMIVFMSVIFAVVSLSLQIEGRRWRYFETGGGQGSTGRIDADPQLSDREELYRKCRERFRESMVGKELKRGEGVIFSDYLARVQRHTMRSVTDFGWKCWCGLAVWILVNGVRARITAPNSLDEDISVTSHIVNLASYIAMVGYITMIIFLLLHFVVQSKLRAFTSEPAAKLAPNGVTWVLKDPAKDYLFFGSMQTTAQLFQTIILILEWYFAVFSLVMLGDVFRVFPAWASLLFIVFAIVPLIVFALVFPWTVTMITILQFSGEGLDVKEAKDLVAVLEERERKERTLTMRDNDDDDGGGHGGGGGGGTGIARNDEWAGAPVSLHETSDKAAALDVVAPTFDVRTFQQGKEALEAVSKTRKGFDPKSKKQVVTDNVGVSAFSAGTQRGSAVQRLNDVWSMLSMPPPATSNRASGWVDSTVHAPDKKPFYDSLTRPLVAADEDDDMAQL